jgi:cytochrome c oxidase subunit 3
MFTLLGMFWIVALFATLALVLELRWAHSTDWISIPLPHVLYMNTAILVGSSLTIEFARFSLRVERIRECVRWIRVTLLLGLAFIAGQIVAWRELIFRGLHPGSNLGSFFFFLITGAHGLLFVGGIVLLGSVGLFGGGLASTEKRQVALGNLSLYWHFLDGLWLCLLVLLFMTIQR